MKIFGLKKKIFFSLIVTMTCFTVLSLSNGYLNIKDSFGPEMASIKEKEMKFMYGERTSLGDRYTGGSQGSSGNNVTYSGQLDSTYDQTINNNISSYNNGGYTNLINENAYTSSGGDFNFSNFMYQPKVKTITEQLKNQVDSDSCRNKILGLYYINDFDYTFDALRELEPVITKTAEAQKIPKALLSAVLFREMMFLGQEDLLDGVPFLGGKSIGICQIGIDNVRLNEQIVHGKSSLIINYSDDDIKEMLETPELAVYFCAVQLKARAIKITGDKNVDLKNLKTDKIEKVLEEYNQSKITTNIGPIKTKEKYAEETYKYYQLFSEYYSSEEAAESASK